MKKINLYLDDLRKCPEGFEIARTMEEAIELMKNNEVHILSLDHDLGEDKEGKLLPSGMDFVDFFIEHGYHADKIYLHTDNPVGRANMLRAFEAAIRRGLIREDIEIYRYPYTKNIYE